MSRDRTVGYDDWSEGDTYTGDADPAPMPFANQCPHCEQWKDEENAVCDDCGDRLGCTYCGGTRRRDNAACPECTP